MLSQTLVSQSWHATGPLKTSFSFIIFSLFSHILMTSQYQHKEHQAAHVRQTLSSWCAVFALPTSAQGGLLFHPLECTSCQQTYHESSVNYKLATSTQKNILETVEIVKTENTAKPSSYFWGRSGVCLFWVFWRRKVISEAEKSWQCGKHTERSCSRKTELSVSSSISTWLYSI